MPTIGVALPIPDPWGRQLQDYRLLVGDDSAAHIPSHITLVPPVDAPDAALPAIIEHLEAVAAASSCFRVHLRGTGTFRPVSPVVFVMLAEGIAQCEQLAAALRREPLAVELNFPYHPHVTIAHRIPDADLDRAFAELAGFECDFEVASFHLYIHDEVEGWRPAREFALTAATPALA